jgi:hypothetical protein
MTRKDDSNSLPYLWLFSPVYFLFMFKRVRKEKLDTFELHMNC